MNTLDDISLHPTPTSEIDDPTQALDATPRGLGIDLRDTDFIKTTLPGRFFPIDHPLVLGVQKLPEHLPLDDRPKIGIPYLSPSQFSTYHRCSALYYLRYGLGKKELTNSAMVFGSACHAGWHAHLDAIRYRHDDPIGIALEAIFGYLAANPVDIWKPKYTKAEEYDNEDNFVESVLCGYELLVPRVEEIDPVQLEQGYVILWKDGSTLPILGYGDAIERITSGDHAGEHGIVDYKTSGKSLSERDLEYNSATKIYAAAHELVHGVPTRQRRFLGVARNKVPKVFESVLRSEEPFPLDRLYANSRALTFAREAGVYLAIEDPQICGGCTLTQECVANFGAK